MKLRLFLAVKTPPEIATRLQLLQTGAPGASWRPAENFHITLRFLGDTDEQLARQLDEELARIVMAPFEVSLKGVGSFGGHEPKSLWAGVRENPSLTRLAAACEKTARRVGLPADPRNYRPHVTLAYCHGTTDFDAAAYQVRFTDFETEAFWIDHFAMYSSWSTKTASHYEEEAVYPLTG